MDSFEIPGKVDEALGWPFGRSERLAKLGRLPHYRLPDGSIRFRLDEVLAVTKHVRPERLCASCGAILELPQGDLCVRCRTH